MHDSKSVANDQLQSSIIFIDDWRCDQYRWCNKGVKKLPKHDPKIKKSYFQIDTPDNGASHEFMKHAYQLLSPATDKGNAVLIHYLGNEAAARDFPHGNNSQSKRAHVRTCPSVIEKLKKSCTHGTAATVYRNLIADVPPSTHIAVLQPKDTRQVKNIKSQQQKTFKLTHDSLYNLHEIAADVPDFVHAIITHPDLICVCGSKELLEEFDRVLLLESPVPQLLSYDTTFQLGDFYLSTLAFRHTLFEGGPVLPVAFLIHERKVSSCHEELFKVCSKLVPPLKYTKKPIVTDEEQAYINVISKYLPLAPHLRCWNHIMQDVKRWLTHHGASSDDKMVYINDLKELFHLPTQEDYSGHLQGLAKKWSAPFFDYYNRNIHPDIATIARWSIQRLGVYHPFNGVTNNQAEGINFVLKQLQDWKEAPVDCMILALHYLHGYYMSEISRGQQNLGNYRLHPKFSNCSVIPGQLPQHKIYSPKDIVKRIKEKLDHEKLLGTTTETSSVINESARLGLDNLSKRERAIRVLDEGKISVDTKLHTFTIMGSTCPHLVTLFPKETCTCPSTTQCYHILAAKLAIGQELEDSKKKINLAQLHRNSRSRGSKKSGRKRPHPLDYDVIPAPDAMASAQAPIANSSPSISDNIDVPLIEKKASAQAPVANSSSSISDNKNVPPTKSSIETKSK